jgi:hypothetical protein
MYITLLSSGLFMLYLLLGEIGGIGVASAGKGSQ